MSDKNMIGVMHYTLLVAALTSIGYGIYRIDQPWLCVAIGCFIGILLVGLSSMR